MGEELDPAHHIFRYVGGASIDGDDIDSAAFRRKLKDGVLEAGLSTNWVEWFGLANPRDAVAPLKEVFTKKNFSLGATSKFALLNVGEAKEKTSKYAAISVAYDPQPNDESHALVSSYQEALNDQVAEQLQKAIIASFPTKSAN